MSYMGTEGVLLPSGEDVSYVQRVRRQFDHFLKHEFSSLIPSQQRTLLDNLLSLRPADAESRRTQALFVAKTALELGAGDVGIPVLEKALRDFPDNPTLLIWLYRCVAARYSQSEITVLEDHADYAPSRILDSLAHLPIAVQPEASIAALAGQFPRLDMAALLSATSSTPSARKIWSRILIWTGPKLALIDPISRAALLEQFSKYVHQDMVLPAATFAQFIRAASLMNDWAEQATDWALAGCHQHPENETLKLLGDTVG